MAKIRLTKGELKRQRDSLARYERYLPILQLKKQQLQLEIVRELAALQDRKTRELEVLKSAEVWAGLLSDPRVNLRPYVVPKTVAKSSKNVAGADIPVFVKAEFIAADYDLFLTPFWVDGAVDALKTLAALREESRIIEEGIKILKSELRITTQRVNLFEKVKIPEAEEAIRRIKIYIGDQMTNAVGRCKIAKRKIEEAMAEEALV